MNNTHSKIVERIDFLIKDKKNIEFFLFMHYIVELFNNKNKNYIDFDFEKEEKHMYFMLIKKEIENIYINDNLKNINYVKICEDIKNKMDIIKMQANKIF